MSKNSLDLIGSAGFKLAGKKSKAFLGAFFYLLPILGFCAIPYAGWAIGIILFGFLTPGYINFMKLLLDGENPKYDVIFRGKGDIMASIFLGILLAGGMILGSALLIVPGMIFASFYSMSFYFLNEDKITTVFGSMENCAKNMNGNKTNMFAYKVIFYIYYIIIALCCGALAFLVWALCDILWLAVIFYIILAIGFILLTSLCTMFLYSANYLFYEEVIAYREAKKARAAKTVEKEATKTEVVVEEKPAEEKPAEAPAKKPAEKKPAAKKPVAKVADKPATKAPAKKPAAKKTVVKKEAIKK